MLFRSELYDSSVSVHLIEPGAYPTPCLTTNAKFAKDKAEEESPQGRSLRYFAKLLFDKSPNKVDEISNKILEIAESNKAPFRNLMGKGVYLRYLARRFLPWSFYESMVVKRMKASQISE